MDNPDPNVILENGDFARAGDAVRRDAMWLSGGVLFLITVVAIVALGAIKERFLLNGKDALQAVLTATDESLALWVSRELSGVRDVVQNPRFVSAVEEQVDRYQKGQSLVSSSEQQSLHALETLSHIVSDSQGFFVAGKDGVVLASSEVTRIGKPSHVRHQRLDLYEQVLQGGATFVPPIPSDISKNDDVLLISGMQVAPTMVFMAPIHVTSGEVEAVLGIYVDPRGLFSEIARSGRIGESGETYLFDRAGRLLSESRFPDHLRQIGLMSEGEQSVLSIHIRDPLTNLLEHPKAAVNILGNPLTKMAASATRGNADFSMLPYRDYRGVPVVGVWKWNQRFGFGITSEMDYAEVMKGYRNVRSALIGVWVGVLALVLGYGYFVFRINANANRALVAAHAGLEKRVQERTRAYRESERALKHIVDHVPVGIFMKDLNGRYVLLNETFCEITGVSQNEALGQTSADVFSSSHENTFDKNDQKVMTLREIVSVETRSRHPDGEMRDYLETKVPIQDDSGTITGMLGVAVDITERKKTEKALQESRGFAEYAEERWRAIIDNQGDAVITINQEGQVLSFSKVASETFGYTQDEIVGQNVNLLMTEADSVHHDGYLKRFDNQGGSRHVGKNRLLVARRKDGSEFKIELVVTPLTFHDEQIFIGVLRDITDRVKMEEDMLAARLMAEEASQAKSDFLASMSHEIRTPMNGVLGMLGLLAKTELNSDQSRKLDIATTSAQSLLTLINDILDFSKVEAGKLELEELDFYLREKIEEVAQSFALKAHEKGLEIVVDLIGVKRKWVRGDPSRMRQVLSNLVGNALKFTNHGEIVIRATLENRADQGFTLSCSVIDTGIGIPKEKVDKLFQRFTQVDSSVTRKYGGTGLGLAISKRLADLMSGEIKVESHEGYGSEFTFHLPLEASSKGGDIFPDVEQGKIRLLLIDGHETNRRVLADQLTQWKVSVFEADSLNEARRQCHGATKIDVVFIDSGVSNLRIEEVVEQVRQYDGVSSAKFFAICGHTEKLDSHSLSGSVTGVFYKPLTTSDLFDALAFALGEKDADGVIQKHQLRRLGQSTEGEMESIRWPDGTRILVVEDNQVNQFVARELLDEFGLNCDVAGNGVEAIDCLKNTALSDRYTLVLMDCQMPEMDGYEATGRIRRGEAGEHHKDIPVVAMTANAMQGDKEKCLASGMNDYISKPLDHTRVRDALLQWVGGTPLESPKTDAVEKGVYAKKDQAKKKNTLVIPSGLITADLETNPPSIARKPSAYVKLLGMYVRNNKSFSEDLSRAREEQDLDKMALLLHGIKGASGNMGMMVAFDHCKKVEKKLKATGEISDDAFATLLDLIDRSFEDAALIIQENGGAS